MRKTITNRALGATLGVLTIASMSLGVAATSAQAAPAKPIAHALKGAAATGNASSASLLSSAALAAGKAKFGADATTDEAVSAYWTPSRMRAATPVEDSPQLTQAIQKFTAKQQADRQAGRAQVTNDGPARSFGGATSKVFSAAPKATTGGGSSLAAYNPNVPYYTPTAYTAGKVFFTQPGVGNFVCSGTIVNSEGKDTVWTAGHCVNNGSGTWMTNWTFVPAYDDDLANPRPYGTWSANQLWSRTAWINSSDFSQDMGVAIMNTNFGGWHIVDYFGGQGIRVNQGKNVYDYAFGYPAEWPFDGGNLYRCSGTTSPEWDYWFTWSQTVKIPCDMTRGSSGGGWLNGYDGNWGYLNGVNSRIDRISGPTIMLSPYFDDDAWNLFNSTRWI
jgi:V8-like Glu-specific endopeptidase